MHSRNPNPRMVWRMSSVQLMKMTPIHFHGAPDFLSSRILLGTSARLTPAAFCSLSSADGR